MKKVIVALALTLAILGAAAETKPLQNDVQTNSVAAKPSQGDVQATVVAAEPSQSDGNAARKKVYDETIDPIAQIDSATAKAKAEGKFVVCQVGGNWCPWCLRFAEFAANDTAISRVIAENFEYIHVNYDPRRQRAEQQQSKAQQPSQTAQNQQQNALMARLNGCGRFGFPVFVVLDGDGKVIHIQDSSFLEEGQGYSQKKVLRFFQNWTPKAVGR